MDSRTILTSIHHAFRTFAEQAFQYLPGSIAGVLVLLAGWLVARLCRGLTRQALRRMGFDAMAERTGLSAVLERLGGLNLSKALAAVVYLCLLLVFVFAAAKVSGLSLIDEGIRALFAYLPSLLTALAILLFGLWAADKAQAAVSTLTSSAGLPGGKIVARMVYALVVVFMSITALNVAGIDTELITSNILLLFGAVLIAFSIAYGFAARDIFTNILSSYYTRDRFKPGMRIRIGDDEGVIEHIDSISVVLHTGERHVVIPVKRLISERVEVLDMNEQ
ncbi:MAG: mechanosensitive ion channel [Flavobacteriales bacterium]|nr:mechanosensitive ion channel [Flavobacteriales bacterium]